jgi:hypothetical protein
MDQIGRYVYDVYIYDVAFLLSLNYRDMSIDQPRHGCQQVVAKDRRGRKALVVACSPDSERRYKYRKYTYQACDGIDAGKITDQPHWVAPGGIVSAGADP